MISEIEQYQKAKFLGKKEIRLAQTAMLRSHLLYARENSTAYKSVLSRKGLDIERMELEHLSLLPLTEKKDIESAPDSFLAVERHKIADIVLSSGTTGKPLPIFYTGQDLKRLAYNEAQAFAGCGIQAGDTALLTCTMDRCFVAGLAYFLGLRELGATVIRNGHGVIESHAEMIRTLRPTVIVGVPTFLKKLALSMNRTDSHLPAAGVRKIICIGEPLRGRRFELLGIGEELEELWGAKVYSTYASSETITTFCECTAQRGGHLLPELAVIEIVDDHGEVLPPGETGEIVLTPLAVEGMPLIRYKTGDISFMEESPCGCGRFSPRLGPILGRKNHLMKVKGTSFYPQAVFDVLENSGAVSNYYIEVFHESELSDRLVVHAATEDPSFTRLMLEDLLVAKLRVKPEVLMESDEIIKRKVFMPRSRKPVRFFDGRKEYVRHS